METSSAKMETSSAKMETSSAKMETSIKGTKKRMKPDKLYQSIVAYCCDEYKSVDEISTHLNLTTKYLQNKAIPHLLASGKLERLYPHNPNHPQQKYKVKV
jgi:ATP-dependent DNA helicase RecG